MPVEAATETRQMAAVSNFPLRYKLCWLPRFLRPSLAGAFSSAPLTDRLLPELPARSVRLMFLGDISGVANGAPPFVDPSLRDLLASADLVVGNCESPVVAKPNARLGTALGTRHAMTADFLRGVLDAACLSPARTVLSLANNHALDQGVDGFEETLAALDKIGVRTAGAGQAQSRVEAGPLTVGLIAFTQWRNMRDADFRGRIAMLDDPGVLDLPRADLVCAVPHWDWEFRHFPQLQTRALARRLSQAGVSVIAGHHTHVVQPLERSGDAVVAYGLGDFLGTAFTRQPFACRICAMLEVEVSADPATRGRVAAYRLHPFFRRRDGYCERLVPLDRLDAATAARVRARIDAIYRRSLP